MQKRLLLIIGILVLTSLACQFISGKIPLNTQSENPTSALISTSTRASTPTSISTSIPESAAEPVFSEITFCADVTDDGECIEPTNSFPNGTETVWAYFTYQDTQNGMAWGRLWEREDEVYIDARDEVWEGGENGWLAYSLSGEEDPLLGAYTLTLYIGDEAVQTGSFDVEQMEAASGEPAFGPISFGSGITDAKTAIAVNTQFNSGITRVYASFAYTHIDPELQWGREWLHNGEALDQFEGAWGTPAEGVTYVYLNDDLGLAPGEYTLNLYLDGQVVQTANFAVGLNLDGGRPAVPGEPAELVDSELMPAYEMLANSSDQLLYLLAELVTDRPVEVRMTDSLEGATAAYSRDIDTCYLEPNRRPPGMVIVNRSKYNEQTWEQVAAAIAHELTHAHQHLSGNGRCEGCSIQKEYEAFLVYITALEEMGRLDLAQAEFPNVVDDYGNIDGDLLWWAIKEIYTDCPDY